MPNICCVAFLNNALVALTLLMPRLDAALPIVDQAVDHATHSKGCTGNDCVPVIEELMPRRKSSTSVKRRNPGPVAPADSHLLEADHLEAEVEAEGMLALMRQGLQYLCAREHRYAYLNTR